MSSEFCPDTSVYCDFEVLFDGVCCSPFTDETSLGEIPSMWSDMRVVGLPDLACPGVPGRCRRTLSPGGAASIFLWSCTDQVSVYTGSYREYHYTLDPALTDKCPR